MKKRVLAVMVCMMAVVNFASADMEWVYINDPGVSGHEGFTGYMSKYLTTNAQYCQFLNDAFASGDITVSGNDAIGADGSNSGADYAGEVYYDGDGPGYNHNGATNGGAARINYVGGVFSVDSGFENHPVTYDSWYGATAFCNYYGYRLPTEWEWQAVADYDGSYNYGCGTSINNSIANYYNSIHPDGTTIVGAFGTYGYGMCDLAGNLWEWTSSYDGSNLHTCGNSWGGYDYYASVSFRSHSDPSYASMDIGIRVVLDTMPISIDIKTVIADKLNLVEQINAALDKEQEVYDALDEMLVSGDYSGLSHGDIVTARQKIHSAMQHQEQAKKDLEKSIEKLADALESLGSPLEP